MTTLSFVGNALTAFGPAVAVLVFYVGRSARLFMMALTRQRRQGAFIWLLSILLSSLLGHFIEPVRTNNIAIIIMSVVLQELARLCCFLAFNAADATLNLIAKTPDSPFNRVQNAFAAGYGFGIISGLITYITPLAESTSPGVMECSSCPGSDVFFIGAITTCLFIFLHISWSVMAFDGWFSKQWLQFAWVVLSHVGASMATLLIPSTTSNGCVISIAVSAAVLSANAAYCVWRVNWTLKSKSS
nr:gamma secretase complex protein [Polyrhizophydium stewartii]